MPQVPAPAAFNPPTPVQLAGFREQLEEQRRFRLEQLDQLRVVDPGNTSEVTEVLAAGARAALRDVLAALYRIDDGTYGLCTDCGAQLPLERLEILPSVGQCLQCRVRTT